MNAPDTLKRLEGEPEIPSLTPRGGASSHKPIIAASVLILSLVGALGFAATRYFGKKEAPPEAAVDVASATVTKLKFQDPPVVVPAPVPVAKAIPVVDQTRVPSIEADATASATAIRFEALRVVGRRSRRCQSATNRHSARAAPVVDHLHRSKAQQPIRRQRPESLAKPKPTCGAIKASSAACSGSCRA